MTRLPRSVLVAVDFGDASAHAIAVAGTIAERCAVQTLTLVHAEPTEAPVYFTPGQIAGLERQRRALEAQARQYLTRFGRQHTSAPFSSSIVDGPPADAILDESSGADLVVMGTHGRQGPKRWWLGSVAERVLRSITRPLLIVRGELNHPAATLFDRVVVHAGDPGSGGAALDYARALTAHFGGETLDLRQTPIEHAVAQTQATAVVIAAPEPRTGKWMSHYAEALIRSCSVPVLFIPQEDSGRLPGSTPDSRR
jgi:nucleotide-binding universal stress UspA family protein